MNYIYSYNIAEAGFSLSRGTGLLIALLGFLVFLGLYFSYRFEPRAKPVFYVLLVFGLISLVEELLGYKKYLENIKALESGESIKVYCGKLNGIDPRAVQRVIGNVEYFSVGKLDFNYNIQSPRYSYNIPISKNLYFREENVVIIYVHYEDILKIDILPPGESCHHF